MRPKMEGGYLQHQTWPDHAGKITKCVHLSLISLFWVWKGADVLLLGNKLDVAMEGRVVQEDEAMRGDLSGFPPLGKGK